MTPEWKQKWIEALRSGKYLQGHGQLRIYNELEEDYRYCCLGVLCDLVDPDGWDGAFYEHHGFANKSWAPQSVEKIVGGIDPNYTDPDYQREYGRQFTLAQINDGENSFEKVINWIEENL